MSSVASLRGLQLDAGESARSSCFHNYNTACSLASKHGTSAGPSTLGRESNRDRCILGPAVSRGQGGA